MRRHGMICYQAGQQGVVDSARFLVAFSVVPSVQGGAGALRSAASRGDAGRVTYLIDEEDAEVDATAADGTSHD